MLHGSPLAFILPEYEMMDDGFTYPEIIRELAKDGVDLNEVNLCHWKPGGHQDSETLQRIEEMLRLR